MTTRLRTILVLIALLASVLLAARGSASEGDTTTTSIVPPDGADLGGMPADEVASYAENRGVSLEAAVRMIRAENDITDFADQVRHEPWYAGFKIVTSGETVGGVLAVTEDPSLEIPAGLNVEVVIVRLSEGEYPTFQDSMKARLQDRIPDLVAVTYEPFEDVVLVWRSAGSTALSEAEASAIEASTRGELDARFDGVAVRIVTSPAAVLAFGEGPDLAVRIWPLILLGVVVVWILWLTRRTGARTPNS